VAILYVCGCAWTKQNAGTPCGIISRTLHATRVDGEDHLNDKSYHPSYFGKV
jgi:hypothetical protein